MFDVGRIKPEASQPGIEGCKVIVVPPRTELVFLPGQIATNY